MVDQIAPTGNSMIPSNPSIAAQQIAEGAQQIAPLSAGAPPTSQVPQVAVQPPVQAPSTVEAPVQAPLPVEAYDFWSGVEKRVDPSQVPTPVVAPPAQAPSQEQIVAPVAAPAQQPAQLPSPEMQLSPEQQAAIVEAGAAEAPTPTQAPAPAPTTDLSAMEAQTIAHLAKTEYALPEAVATRLVSEPEVVYPELAARLHVRLAGQIGQAMQQLLPGIIEQVVDRKIAAQSMENDFFRSYPQLADRRFRPVVTQSLRMARTASPQAGRDQVMSDGAALAAIKLRLQLTNGLQQPVVALQAPPALQPFQPAVGSSAQLPLAMPEVNEFELLANDQNW